MQTLCELIEYHFLSLFFLAVVLLSIVHRVREMVVWLVRDSSLMGGVLVQATERVVDLQNLDAEGLNLTGG